MIQLRRPFCFVCILAATGIVLAHNGASKKQGASRQISRPEFAIAWKSLPESSSPADVLKRVGPPDDILDEAELLAIGKDGREAYAYGTNGHLTFPTLGFVAFTELGPRGIYREIQTPPINPNLVDEETVRNTLRTLDCGSYRGSSYMDDDPVEIIRTVNALVPLGKEKAIAVAREYLRILPGGSRQTRLYDALRTLFYFPNGFGDSGWCDIGYGPTKLIPDPETGREFQWDPLIVQQDIPLPLSDMDPLGNIWQIKDYLDVCEKYGVIRSQPLTPPDNLLSAYDLLLTSDLPKQAAADSYRGLDFKSNIAFDFLQLLETAGFAPYGPQPTGSNHEGRLSALRPSIEEANVRWDRQTERYVRGDGAGSGPKPLIRTMIWKVDELKDYDLRVLFSCTNLKLNVAARWAEKGDNRLAGSKLLIYGGADGDRLIQTLEFVKGPGGATVDDTLGTYQGTSWAETTHVDSNEIDRETSFYMGGPSPQVIHVIFERGPLKLSSPEFQASAQEPVGLNASS